MCVLSVVAARGIAGAELRVAVLRFRSIGVAPWAAELATTVVREGLANADKELVVLRDEEVKAGLREAGGMDFSRCSDAECAATAGKALAVPLVVVGSVQNADSGIRIRASLVEVDGRRIRTSAEVKTPLREDQVRQACGRLAAKLTGGTANKEETGWEESGEEEGGWEEGGEEKDGWEQAGEKKARPRIDRPERGGPMGVGLIVGGGGLLGGDLVIRMGRFALVGMGAWRPAFYLSPDAGFLVGAGEAIFGGGCIIYFTGDRRRVYHQGLEFRFAGGTRSDSYVGGLAYHLEVYMGRSAAFTGAVGLAYITEVSEEYCIEQFGPGEGYYSSSGPTLYWAFGFRFYAGKDGSESRKEE